MIVRAGSAQRREQTARRVVKGYAKSRQDYDARRRASRLDALGEHWKAIVQADPCAFCEGPGGDADHIEALLAGGRHEWQNFTGLCRRCNASKKNSSLLAFMLRRNGAV